MMRKNGVASTLRAIGIIECVCGLLLGFWMMAEDGDMFPIAVAIALTSFITCMAFVGFSEIIDLLQKNADTQEKILSRLGGHSSSNNQTPNSVLHDIESNLPEL